MPLAIVPDAPPRGARPSQVRSKQIQGCTRGRPVAARISQPSGRVLRECARVRPGRSKKEETVWTTSEDRWAHDPDCASFPANPPGWFRSGYPQASAAARFVPQRRRLHAMLARFTLLSTKLTNAEQTTRKNFASSNVLVSDSSNACRIPPSSDV